MNVAYRVLVNSTPGLLVMFVDEDAMSSALAVQLHPTDRVRLVPALKEPKRKEAPIRPRELLEGGKVVESGVVKREWLGC